MVSLAPVAVSVQNAKPNYAYGQLGTLPFSTTQAAFVRVGLPAAIADDAVIASATLILTQAGGLTGSATANLRKATASFNVSRTTWNNQPAIAGSTVAVTKSNTATTTKWSFDVTADVQAWASGTSTNFGWRLITTAAVRFRGSSAAGGQPVLVVEYVEPGDAPEDLSPNGGVVSIAKPTLSFLAAPDTTAVQVQVDADTLGTADFDSGEVASTAGQLDLNTTSYAGLAAGATTFWRARTRGGTGLTPWSAWASFSRVVKPTVAITSPATTSDDGTPPIQWTVSGGTQESYRVIVTNAAGAVVADSGRVGSALMTYSPLGSIMRTEGESVTITVRVWDNVDRVTTPGDPEYVETTRDVTLVATGSINPTSVAAVNSGGSPAVVVTATSAAAPDGWAVIRDGVRVYYNPAQPTTNFAWTDWSAAPGKDHTYRAARVVGTTVSPGGPSASVTPTVIGVWLVDPEDGTAAAMYGTDGGSWQATELAIIHQPVAGPPIRRVAYRPPLSGSFAGQLVDTPAQSAAVSTANLYAFKSSPANRVLQLVLGDRSIPVNVGDITVFPTPIAKLGQVTFNWWQVADVPWTA